MRQGTENIFPLSAAEGGMAEVLMLHKASVPVIKFFDPLTCAP